MNPQPVLTVSLVMCALFAGCAGGSEVKATTPTTTAPSATANAEFGSIAGKVVDEEMVPVAGASVVILRESFEATTDDAGAFTFNDLPSGTYTLVAARLGYKEGTARVEVVVGEVKEVTMSLLPLVIPEDPYQLVIPRVTLINFGNAWAQYVTQVVNVSQVTDTMCSGCNYVVHFTQKPVAMVTESLWECGSCNDVLNHEVWYKALHSFTTGMTPGGTLLFNTYLVNREQYSWAEDDVTAAQKLKEPQYLVQLGADQEGVNYNHKFELYHSFAYVEEFPEGYTALPPE